MRLFTVIFFLMFCSVSLFSQRFLFGTELAVTSSQVEGDKLNGFNRYGYSFGLIGGYAINSDHYLIVSPQFTSLGSNHSGERFPRDGKKIFVEMDFTTANVLFAYSYRFGDTWTGQKKYRLKTGIRVHRLLNVDTNILRSGDVGEVSITKANDLKSYFTSFEIGVGANISDKFGLDLTYHHGLQNLLKEPKINIGKLSPLYLSIGLSYYFGLPGVGTEGLK